MWKKIVLWSIFGLLTVASGFCGFLVAKYQTRFERSISYAKQDFDNDLDTVDLKGIKTNSDTDIVNILVLGNDKRVEYDGRNEGGLSDVMMIGTMDLKHNQLKLTSLMRDTYVEIPDHGSAKLNAAYPYGGVRLLYRTIAQNFNIKLDGYVEVGFDAFTDVINDVGGVDIKVTKSEADYLNTTNYIRKRKYRTIKEGWNHMNGWQALGYCRIRYQGETVNGLRDDFGRTYRQRTVITAAFDQIKKMPKSKWMNILDDVMKNVKTDLSRKEIMSYITDVIGMGTMKINQLQIPYNGYFTSQRIDGVGSCLVLNTQQDNIDILNQFIFKYDGKKEFTYKPSSTSAGTAVSSAPLSSESPYGVSSSASPSPTLAP